MAKRKMFATPVAIVSFREKDGDSILLVSESRKTFRASIFFKISGVTQEELDSPTYLLPNGNRGNLKDAILEVMKGQNFHNFYPDFIKDNPEGGVYAGTILRRHLMGDLKKMRPDLRNRTMFIDSVIVSFGSINSANSAAKKESPAETTQSTPAPSANLSSVNPN